MVSQAEAIAVEQPSIKLEVKDLAISYDGQTALSGVSLQDR